MTAAVRVEVLPEDELPAHAAALLATELRAAVAVRGRATLALSGGSTPGPTLRALSELDVPWAHVHVLQVDERIAPEGDEARNLTSLRTALLDRVELPAGHLHPMPIEPGTDPEVLADRYGRTLAAVAGDPPVLDVVQLGLGTDGHTASLVPGAAVLDVVERSVAVTGAYRGHRRLTLTQPVLDRARRIVWIVQGADKADALGRLRAGDRTIPGGRVRQDHAVVVADRAATRPRPSSP